MARSADQRHIVQYVGLVASFLIVFVTSVWIDPTGSKGSLEYACLAGFGIIAYLVWSELKAQRLEDSQRKPQDSARH
jgi:hypothetical protein